MKVTRVLLRAELNPRPGSRLVATASVEFDHVFAVHMVRVVAQPSGEFIVAMPSRRDAMGRFRDYAHPTKAELRSEIEKAVLSEFEAQISGKL